MVNDKELSTLLQHGLQYKTKEYITMVLGNGRQTRSDIKMLIPDKGYMKQEDVVDCDVCRRSSFTKILGRGLYGDWYEGYTAKEKHSQINNSNHSASVGLKLKCFYSMYIDFLIKVKQAYEQRGDITESRIAKQGRAALVVVKTDDILCVYEEPKDRIGSQTWYMSGITVKVYKLKVLDLIDQFPLIPEERFVNFILAASAEWHYRWHSYFDNIQPRRWQDFPEKVIASLELANQSL